MSLLVSQSRWLRRIVVSCFELSSAISALLSPMAMARPWPIPQSSWSGSVQDYPAPSAPPRPWWIGIAANGYGSGYGAPAGSGYQAYGTPPLTPEQQAQRCNTGRLIGGHGGGAVAYAMSRDDGRAWAIPLGALVGSRWDATRQLARDRCHGEFALTCNAITH